MAYVSLAGMPPGANVMDWIEDRTKRSPDAKYNALLEEVAAGIKNYQDPYLGQMETLTRQWLDPNYRYYTDEQMQDQYNRGKAQLEGDVFKAWDDNYGQTMANRNLSGSGVANLAYGKILGQKGGALADLWGDIQSRNDEATRTRQNIATSLLPTMSQLSRFPLEQQMQLLSIMQGDKSAEASKKAANAQGWGMVAATAVPAILSWLGI